MIRAGKFLKNLLLPLVLALGLIACGEESKSRRTVRQVGAQNLRTNTLAVCREGFAVGTPQKIPEQQWPESVRVFQPASLWAEPDGAYLLIYSDADGERGIYLPRILSDQDPVCGPTLQHVKLASGVYTYDRKRR